MHICSTIWFYNTTKTKTNFNTLVNVGTSENRSGYICSNVVETYLRPTPLSILIIYGQPHYQSLSFTANPIINPYHLRPTQLSILISYGQPHYQSLSFTANSIINTCKTEMDIYLVSLSDASFLKPTVRTRA